MSYRDIDAYHIAVALSDESLIAAGDLNIDLESSSNTVLVEQLDRSVAAMDSGERDIILNMLSRTRWNRKEAAKQLGMTYRQLRYRIQQYGIDEDETGT